MDKRLPETHKPGDAGRGLQPEGGLIPSFPSSGVPFTAADRDRLVHCEQMLSELLQKFNGKATPENYTDEDEYRRALAAFKNGDRKPLDLYKKRGGVIPKRAKVRLVK